MQIKPIPRLIDHLWYPILVRVRGSNHCRIVEMQGCEVNAWNEYVRSQKPEITVHGWVWKKKSEDDTYNPSYTPANHIPRGELYALVDPSDLINPLENTHWNYE